MKKTKITTVSILIFLLLIAGGLVALTFYRRQQPPPLQVTATKPVAGGSISPFATIEITFNRQPRAEEIQFKLKPDAQVSRSFDSHTNTLVLNDPAGLQPLTSYLLIFYTQPPFQLQFTTQEEAGNMPHWNENFQEELDKYFQEYGPQEEALRQIRRSVPITTDNFSVNYRYSDNTYIITLFPPYDQSKQKAIDWFFSRHITNLSSVRIEWKNK